MKLASLNYDVTDYAMNDKLEKIAELVQPLSEQAKMANIPDYNDQLLKKDTDFAVILLDKHAGELRKFACYTPELVEINMSFLVSNMNELPEEIVKTAATNLTCAAHKFNVMIPEELSKYASHKFIGRLVKLANVDQKEYSKKMENSTKLEKTASSKKMALNNKYPISNKEEIEKAAAWFERNLHELNIEDKMEFVNNVKTAASQHDISLEKTALYPYLHLDPNTFNEDLFAHIGVRKSYIPDDDEEYKNIYNEALRQADTLGPIKTAYLIELLDEETNLKNTCGNKLVDPLLATLGTVKKAGLEIDGNLISKKDLQKLSSADLTRIVGNDMIKEIKGPDGLEVVASLPKPIRSELMTLLVN